MTPERIDVLSVAHTAPERTRGGDFQNETTRQTDAGQPARAGGGGAGLGHRMYGADSFRRAHARSGPQLCRALCHSRAEARGRRRGIGSRPVPCCAAGRDRHAKYGCLDFSVDKSGKVVYTFKSFRRGMV